MDKENPRYKGKKFIPHFNDPRTESRNAIADQDNVQRKPVGKAGAPGPKSKPKLARTLPLPQNTAGMANPTPLKDDPMYKESIFGTDICVRENNLRTTVQPAVLGYMPTIDTVWQELVASNSNIHKQMIVEGLRYYAVGLLWLRIIQLKKANKQTLTEAETMVASLCDTTVFSVPSPLQIYLQSLGTVKCTGTGQTLIPEFPAMPEQVIAAFGGYFGEMDEANHILYEEFPCLGVAGETLRHSLSNEAAGEYASQLALHGTTVNRNLLGYAPLVNRRTEAKNPFLNLGVTDVAFPESVQNTGFNYDIMYMISTWMATTKTFKNEAVSMPLMTHTGSQSMTIIEEPQTNGIAGSTRNVMGDVIAHSLMRDSVTTFGVAQYTLFQMWKMPAVNARETESIRSRAWCCINFTNMTPVPNAWIANRNERRETMPVEYTARRFETISENNNNLRKRVIEKMVISHR